MTELSALLEKCQQNKTAELNLSNLSLTAIPEIVGSFIWLKRLDIHYNQISDLQPLATLTKLTGLNCSNNQISDLQPLATLTQLTYLDCGKNQISDLQPLATLTQLTNLYCYHNQISDLQPLAKLTELTFISCANNQISDLQPLETLTELTYIFCGDNKISDLQPLAALTKLTDLYCDNNQISDLQPLAALTKLTDLDCRKNQISDLQPLATLTKLIYLDCDNNPIKGVPAEILKQGIAEIQKYLNAEDDKKSSINEIKVMLLGVGNAGKTTIRQRLCNDTIDDHQQGTLGIDITKHNIRYEGVQITVNFWDFAGQEISYSLHELFFSNRCIYIIVLNGRENDDPTPWLEKISSLGGDDSHIIIVRNKSDDLGFVANPDFYINQLKTNFPNIKNMDDIQISAREGGAGFDDFKKILLKTIDNHPQTFDKYPKSYLNIKQEVEQYTKNNDYISYAKYQNICEKHNETGDNSGLLNILADLGVITFFKEPELKAINIINPSWLSGGIYRLLKAAEKSGGIVDIDKFPEILVDDTDKDKKQEWNKEQYPWLITMLQKYQQGIKIADNELLIPRGLNNDFTPDFNKDSALYLRYQYGILHDAIFPRLMVALWRFCNEQKFGKRCFLLAREADKVQNQALIELNKDGKNIDIWITGGAPKSDFLAIICDGFDLVHKKYEDFKVDKLVHIDRIEDEDKFLIYEGVQNHIKRKKPHYDCIADKEYSVDYLKETLGHYPQSETATVTHQTINITGNVDGDVYIGEKQVHNNQLTIQNQQTIQSTNTELNAFLALYKEQSVERQQIIALVDTLTKVLNGGELKTPENKTVLEQAKAAFNSIIEAANQTVQLSENIARIVPWLTKIAELLT